MAKTKSTVGFDQALVHMKAGKRATREDWDREFKALRIDDTGLGNAGEFVRVDQAGRPNRYPLATEDILADDWRLL